MKVSVKQIVAKSQMKGFSLIEIMVVVTLMAIIVGIGTVYFAGVLEQGKIDTARTQAYEIAKALDLYKMKNGDYPSTSEGLDVLTDPPRGKPFMENLPLDPWQNEFNYAYPGTHNQRGVDVWSNGPPGADEGESEIGNWPEDR